MTSPDEMTIIVDTREQAPYLFPCPTVRAKLDAGDYSVVGMATRIAIERKSMTDAYGTFGGGRDRFEREIERLCDLDYAAVVIEASMETMLSFVAEVDAKAKREGKHGLSAKSFNASWIAWAQRYGVQFIFADDRHMAQRQTYLMLERFWRDVQDGKR